MNKRFELVDYNSVMQPNVAQSTARQRGTQLETASCFHGAQIRTRLFGPRRIGALSSPSPSANLAGWPDAWSGLVEGIFANRGSATSIHALRD
jgi:hypothetical protein